MTIDYIKEEISEYFNLKNKIGYHYKQIQELSNLIINTIKKNACIFWCGNGGSAADSQHLAAELVGRFEINRAPIKSIALTTDTSILTAISNDYSFEQVFKRQIQALGSKKDLLIVISTSGNSKNIIEAVKEAKKKRIKTFALLGKSGGKIKKLVNKNIVIPSNKVSRIQEMHILIGHIVSGLAEKKIFKKN
jgi:D-sedoheptulose 7-phosphate isomerase